MGAVVDQTEDCALQHVPCVCTQYSATASSLACSASISAHPPRWRVPTKTVRPVPAAMPAAMKPLVVYGAEGSGNSQKVSPVRWAGGA